MTPTTAKIPELFPCALTTVSQPDGFTPTADEIFQEGDRLSCVPLKIEGAGSARLRRAAA